MYMSPRYAYGPQEPSASSSLHILHLEDNPLDTELVQGYLASDGLTFQITLAASRDEYINLLEKQTFDLVLSDYYLPSFDGMTALQILQERQPDIPFVLFSGAIGELHAIEMLKRGATDYVLKGQWERLGPAVRRALREREERLDRLRAEERFRLAAEAVQGAIYDWNINTGQVFRSERFQELVGFTLEEMESSYNWWQDRIHPDDRNTVETAQESLTGTEEHYATEYRVRHRDGHYVYIWDTGRILRDETGKAVRVVGSSIDITARVEAERGQRESDAFVSRIMESSYDCITILDLNGNFLFMNGYGQKALEITDFQKIAGQFWVDSWSEDDRKHAVTGLALARTGEVHRFQGLYPTQTGVSKWWDVVTSPIHDADGKVYRILTVAREITEQRLAEGMLRERQRQIEDLNKRLQRAIAESHHRIKNNLQVLVSLVETMRFSANRTAPPGELERLARHIRGLAVLHDLLTSETKTPGTELDSVPVHGILERLIPVLEMAAGNQRIQYYADEIRLTLKQSSALSLLVNELVSNALKHGSGTVVLELTQDNATTPPKIRLCVSDNGPGFAEDFDPHQGNSTGLDLVESIGRWDLSGDIVYQNQPQGGAEVIVTFDLLSEEPTLLPPSIAPTE